MYELHFAPTPNGHKARVMIEELGLPYELKKVDIGPQASQQLSPEYRKVSASRRIPALVDTEGPGGKPVTLIESHVIMTYLAAKTKSPLYPTDPATRLLVDQWALHGQSTFGPTMANLTLFEVRFPEDVPSAKKHFGNLGRRVFETIDLHLAGKEYFVGDYSIADIAHLTWVNRYPQAKIDIAQYPNVKRWWDKVSVRPAVQRGLKSD
jgi:GSH-dependent disulfide-bond oxidoreductase